MAMVTVDVDTFEDACDEVKTLHTYFTETLYGPGARQSLTWIVGGMKVAKIVIEGEYLLYSIDRPLLNSLTANLTQRN